MRCAKPSFGDRYGLALLAELEHIVPLGIDVAKRREDIHILARARDPQRQHRRTGDFGIVREWLGLKRDAHLEEHCPQARSRSTMRSRHRPWSCRSSDTPPKSSCVVPRSGVRRVILNRHALAVADKTSSIAFARAAIRPRAAIARYRVRRDGSE